MWEDILKSSRNMTMWQEILVDYDLPLQIARKLHEYNTATKTENEMLSRKLQGIDMSNRGSVIGRVSQQILKLAQSYDKERSLAGGRVEREQFENMSDEEYTFLSKYARHLIEQL